MKIQTQLQKLEGDLWYYVLDIAKEDAEPYIDKDRRVICKIGRSLKFHAALMPNGAGGFFINLNQERRKKLGLVLGQMLEIELEKDQSEYGMPISEELQEVLLQDEVASEKFHKLTAGRQRTLIYWVDNVKNSDIKIRRALVLTSHLKAKETPDFKSLNHELKEANQRARLGKN